MIISTTLNTLNPVEQEGGYPAVKIMRMLYEAGFRAVDLCAFRYMKETIPYGSNAFFSDHWREWIEELREFAVNHGMKFNQSHNLTFNYFMENEQALLLDQMTDRVIEASAMLNIPLTVFHPIAPPGMEKERKICLKKNCEYLKRKAETALKWNLKIGIENMLSNRYFDGTQYPRYCTNTEELLELVEKIHMPNVGVCYDIGHGHYMNQMPEKDICALRPFLWALHIHDNDRWNDGHLIPYQGNVNWEAVCRALAESGYQGDFTLEISNAVSRMPEAVQKTALRSAYEIAAYLVSRIEAYKKQQTEEEQDVYIGGIKDNK